ncbi:MAG: YihY/virulence factor BrkB family protein [Propionibacteriaceae bacterium]|nr:YihY/virulence factor BrkB family protein [Propionibacteriaceae bacterium]
MREYWARVAKVHWVAHVIRAVRRYNIRLGNQFAAGIAFYSTIGLIPILMLTFSVVGIVFTTVQPELLVTLENTIQAALGSENEVTAKVLEDINRSLNDARTMTPLVIVLGLWFGNVWMGNLKRAVRVQLRPLLGKPEARLPMWLDVLANLGILVVLLAGIIVTFFAISITVWLGELLHFPRTVALLVSLVIGVGLFWMLLTFFKVDALSRRAVWEGAVIGSVGLGVLQYSATAIVQWFGHNLTAGVFGSAIVVMLFANLFATLVLFVGAWVGTWEPKDKRARAVLPGFGTGAPAPDQARGRDGYVRQEVAEESMKTGLVFGWLTGAATGAGIGAAVAAWLKRKS